MCVKYKQLKLTGCYFYDVCLRCSAIGLYEVLANQVAAQTLYLETPPPPFWITIDVRRSIGGGGLSADPWYVETISPINRPRQIVTAN